MKVRIVRNEQGFWAGEEGPFARASDLVHAVGKLLQRNPKAIIMGAKFSLGPYQTADPYSTAPYAVLDYRGGVVAQDYSPEALWDSQFPRFLRPGGPFRNASARRNAMQRQSKKWIQKAIKEEGALRKHFGIPEGETIPTSKIDEELAKLKKKSEGDKTLSDTELKLFKQLQMAKTLRSKEVPPPGKKAADQHLRNEVIKLACENPTDMAPHLLPLLDLSRSEAIRLAYQNPKLRPHLLPVIQSKRASRTLRTVEEIKRAVDQGEVVYVDGPGSRVVKDNRGQYLIQADNGYTVGLHGKEGTPYARELNGTRFYTKG